MLPEKLFFDFVARRILVHKLEGYMPRNTEPFL